MGAKSSNLKTLRKFESQAYQDGTEYRESTVNISFPYGLLIDVLTFVSAHDLINNCRFVCKEWRDIIDSHSVWKLKCERERICIPPCNIEKLPNHYYRQLYLYNPYGRNLLKNPSGQDGLNKWEISENLGDGFVVENPPKGADSVPPEVGVQYCFATSFSSCTKNQLIDLLAEGAHSEILDCGSAKIKIGEWYAARFDCASEYKLQVLLLGGNCDIDAEIFENEIDRFEFEFREDQWIGKEWHLVTHTFKDIQKVRYVYFQHSGKDLQFWAGHYGSKMTGAFVNIVF